MATKTWPGQQWGWPAAKEKGGRGCGRAISVDSSWLREICCHLLTYRRRRSKRSCHTDRRILSLPGGLPLLPFVCVCVCVGSKINDDHLVEESNCNSWADNQRQLPATNRQAATRTRRRAKHAKLAHGKAQQISRPRRERWRQRRLKWQQGHFNLQPFALFVPSCSAPGWLCPHLP